MIVRWVVMMRVLICMVASMMRGRRWVRVNWFETYDRAGLPGITR